MSLSLATLCCTAFRLQPPASWSFSTWFNGRSGNVKLAKRKKRAWAARGKLSPIALSVARRNPIGWRTQNGAQKKKNTYNNNKRRENNDQWRQQHTQKGRRRRLSVAAAAAAERRHLKLKSVQIYCFLKSDTLYTITALYTLYYAGYEMRQEECPKRWHTNPL